MAGPKTFTVWRDGYGQTFRVGDEVTLDVEWSGGRVSNMSGTLIWISENGEASVESELGPVAGRADTLERR